MSKRLIYKNGVAKEILLTIARVGVLAVAATSPYFLHNLVKHYFGPLPISELRRRARRLRELQKKKLVDFREGSNGEVKVTLSQNGNKIVREYNLDDLKIKKAPRWDGYWHVIAYDIPTRQRHASNAFREKIQQLGLYRIQKSLWIYPYECMPELEFLCVVFELDINDTIFHFKTKELPNGGRLKKFFNLN